MDDDIEMTDLIPTMIFLRHHKFRGGLVRRGYNFDLYGNIF